MSVLKLLGLDVKKWNTVAEESRKALAECRWLILQVKTLVPKIEKLVLKVTEIADIVLKEDEPPQ